MKISYLIHQFSPKHTSSVEQYCFSMAKEMRSRGNEVSVLTYQHSNKGAKLQKGTVDHMLVDNLTPHRTKKDTVLEKGAVSIDFEGINLREIYHNYKILKDAADFEYYNPVIKEFATHYFEQFKPDIVHALHLKNLSASVIDAAYEQNIPIIFTPTDFWVLCPNFTLLRPDYELCRGPSAKSPCQLCLKSAETLGQKIADRKHQALSTKVKDRLKGSLPSKMVKKFLDNITSSINIQKQWVGIDKQFERKELILRKCEKIKKILAPSQFIMDILVESGFDKAQIEVLPLGFDLIAPKQIEAKGSKKLRIGYIGTINKHKGTHLLIEAIRGIESKHIELKIYGDFTRFHSYTQYVKNLAAHDKRISFKGTFKPENTDKIFSGIDMLCVPSLWYEHIPSVIYSALRHNTPVIAPSFGALTEIIHHTQNGILFKRNDPDDLREKIADILEDMSIIDKISERITPPKTIAEHVDELLNVYENYTFCDK